MNRNIAVQHIDKPGTRVRKADRSKAGVLTPCSLFGKKAPGTPRVERARDRWQRKGKNMAAHQIYYLKIDRSLLNPHDTAEWLTSDEKETAFPDEKQAQTVKGQRPDASGVIKDKDEHYVMRVGLEARYA